MTALTATHLKKLNDADLRTLALRVVNDAVNALDTNIEDHDLDDHPTLDPAPVHGAADWIRELLTSSLRWVNRDTQERHRDAVWAFLEAAHDVGQANTGDGFSFLPWRNAAAVSWILTSVDCTGGTSHRPSTGWLRNTLVNRGDGFMPSHETAVGYVLKVLCDSDDPRLAALAESYLQSGLHVNLRPAINRATRQLARLDELADLNR